MNEQQERREVKSVKDDEITKGDNGEDRTLKPAHRQWVERKKLVKETEWTVKEVEENI